MIRDVKRLKYPNFMGHIYSQGYNIKTFTEMLRSKGYSNYNYNLVRRKLRGESDLTFEDIMIFSKVTNTEPSIFFDHLFTNNKLICKHN